MEMVRAMWSSRGGQTHRGGGEGDVQLRSLTGVLNGSSTDALASGGSGPPLVDPGEALPAPLWDILAKACCSRCCCCCCCCLALFSARACCTCRSKMSQGQYVNMIHHAYAFGCVVGLPFDALWAKKVKLFRSRSRSRSRSTTFH